MFLVRASLCCWLSRWLAILNTEMKLVAGREEYHATGGQPNLGGEDLSCSDGNSIDTWKEDRLNQIDYGRSFKKENAWSRSSTPACIKSPTFNESTIGS